MHFSLSDYVMDAVQNAIEAGSTHIALSLNETIDGGTREFFLEVGDNGCGMDEETLRRVVDPFYTDGKKHPGRKVGLGLAFMKQLLEDTGGSFRLESEQGRGTRLTCRFNVDHVDTPPIGDLAGALMSLFSYPGDFELELQRSRAGEEYRITRSELLEALGGLEDPQALGLLTQYLESQEDFRGETDP